MRVPPDQSCTASEDLSNAISTSRCFKWRDTLVKRVPNTKLCTRSLSLVIACMKCKNILLYWLIDPDTSQSITKGGWRRFCFLNFNGMVSGARNAARKLERISTFFLVSLRWNRRVFTSIIGSRRFLIANFAAAIS